VAQDFWGALALLLVLEGLLPFASPGMLRRVMLQMAELSDRNLRVSGFASMLLGVILLYWVRH
jgi:uncharacterized protein YjeT (DUF2065 family)